MKRFLFRCGKIQKIRGKFLKTISRNHDFRLLTVNTKAQVEIGDSLAHPQLFGRAALANTAFGSGRFVSLTGVGKIGDSRLTFLLKMSRLQSKHWVSKNLSFQTDFNLLERGTRGDSENGEPSESKYKRKKAEYETQTVCRFELAD
jgi:hypothetical protein